MNHIITDTDTFAKLLNKRCVDCPQKAPKCDLQCPGDQECQQTIQTCDQCVTSYCGVDPLKPVQTAAPAPAVNAPPSNNPPSTGAIVGGVVGGLVVIAAVTYLVWRFCIKNKRQALNTEPWDEEHDPAALEAEKAFAARRDQRASTHTTHSIASTVLTRASNIIQIAYIPGVTNRATPTSPTLLVPPVPPIPIGVSQASSPAATEDQHFFVPGDLRDSTYSGISGYSDRTSYARTSYAPRSSIASTIYGKSAVVVAPAQTGMRAKPAMVSVKSTSSHGSGNGSHTPPVPAVDYDKYTGIRPPSPANSTFSVGSTFLNNASAHTAMTARPMMVRVGSAPKKVTTGAKAGESSPLGLSPLNSTRESKAVTVIDDSPSPEQGPFSDPPEDQKSNGSLSAVIEEATRRASQRTTTGTSAERQRSPFGDEHAVKDA